MFANHKGEIPFVILSLPFLAGIGLALYLPFQVSVTNLAIIFACLSIAYIVLNISYKKLALYKHQWIGGVLVNCILCCAGCLTALNYSDLSKADHFSKIQVQYLTVKIDNEPVIKNGLVRFAATVIEGIDKDIHLPMSGKLLISINDSSAFNLNYGDIVLVPAKYNAVDPPFNPGEFNYKQYLAHQNIYHQAFLYPRQYVVVQHNTGNPLIAFSLQTRKQLVARFNRTMHDSSAIAVASTMILGYKADLSEDVLQAYAKTGTLHVLSVSGAHVAIVFILLSWALSVLNRFKHGKIIKTLFIVILIWAYALLTGFSPAVNRAALMISLIIGGNSFYRYVNPLNLLAVSAFALLLYNPYYLTDVGFQLSYLAVGGLIVLQPVLYKCVQIENKWLDKFWKLCSVSIAAQGITFPLSMYYFHQFPVYFLLSNLFILLPVLTIMYIGLAFLLLSWLLVVCTALAYLLEKSIILMNKGLILIEKLPYASINNLWISKIDCLLIYGIVILMFYFLFNRNKLLLNLGLALTLILFVSVGWKKVDSEKSNAITFLNLKKQRVIVFKMGENAIVLSDLKPSDKNYRYSVQQGLDSTKIENIKVFSFTEDINLPYLRKRGNLIRFQNKSIVLLDSSFQKLNLTPPLKPDYVYLTHNPTVSINEVNDIFNYELLVIGADNSDRYIDSGKKHLTNSGKKYYVLKRNKALNLTSD
ncbi:ComEC/Rec2 family competence protein [Mucilaginibacter calamicampi]|uniref:ComEC/Rec2 family competence protein n=1 Tax=Mucilaginibacter calamicampi TaxID=1302352 RepID=A0ABW2YV07_9SPHI